MAKAYGYYKAIKSGYGMVTYEVKILDTNRVTVYCGMVSRDPLINEQYESKSEAEQRAAQVLADKPVHSNCTEIRQYFADGELYPARYPGRDITGEKFEAGTMVYRKSRHFLVA